MYVSVGRLGMYRPTYVNIYAPFRLEDRLDVWLLGTELRLQIAWRERLMSRQESTVPRESSNNNTFFSRVKVTKYSLYNSSRKINRDTKLEQDQAPRASRCVRHWKVFPAQAIRDAPGWDWPATSPCRPAACRAEGAARKLGPWSPSAAGMRLYVG